MENPTDDGLDGLLIDADALSTAPAAAQAQAEQAQAAQSIDINAVQLLMAAKLVRGMWVPLIAASSPRKAAALELVWTDSQLEMASQAGAEVLNLHGIQLGDVLSKYGPYIGLAAALAPPTLATLQIMKAPDPQPAQRVEPAGQGNAA